MYDFEQIAGNAVDKDIWKADGPHDPAGPGSGLPAAKKPGPKVRRQVRREGAMMAACTYFINYESFGSVRPPEPEGRKLFRIYVRGFPGALNMLDGEAVSAIAAIESVKPSSVRLWAYQTVGGTVIERLLRRNHPSFEREVDKSGAEAAWFSYVKPFDLGDF